MKRLIVLAGAALLVLATGCGRRDNVLLLLTEVPDVGSIRFQGNDSIEDGDLRDVMGLRQKSLGGLLGDHRFSERQLQADILAIRTLYLRRGYLRARVTGHQVRERGDEVDITITLDEGVPVYTRSFHLLRGGEGPFPRRADSAYPELTSRALSQGLTLKGGVPFDPYRLEDDRRVIMRNLADRGYLLAGVRADVHFEGNHADIFYRIRPGTQFTVERIAVENNRSIPDRVVRGQMEIEDGDLYRLKRVVRSQRRLMQSGYFSDVQWDTAGVDVSSRQVQLRFRVRERKMRAIEGGLGVSSKGLLRSSGSWGTRNFLHRGIRLAVQTRFDFDLQGRVGSLVDEQRSELILQFPNILHTRWEGQPSLFYVYDKEPGYTQDIYGVGVTSRRRLGELRDQVVLSVENRWVHNEADSASRAQDPQLVRSYYQTRLFTVRGQFDSRDDFFNPRRGGVEEASLELAGGVLGGNNGFRKLTAGVAHFHPLQRFLVLAARIQGGTIKAGGGVGSFGGQEVENEVESIPTEDRYRLGGANTVRGFAQDELDGSVQGEGPVGGLVSLLANLELRLDLLWKLSAVGFLDAGNVWQDRNRIRLDRLLPRSGSAAVTPFDLRYSFGGGLRLNTPVGPVRVDYARKWNIPEDFPESKDRWHVSLGHAF